ncbi:hypothetical protein [Paenibacillus fonticola]|uniref:hypothetical protein n=1 Tax=Paenibacillus fonticola TaxID=379896 RepID=UPI0012FB253B|nr:hypothetical protein [Paenibacillus fonticola]
MGIKVIINNRVIKEDKGYYENFIQIQDDGGSWSYFEMNFERRHEPGKEEVKKFDNEKTAIKYFFLKTLRRFYFYKIHIPNNPIRSLQTIEELKHFLENLGVSDERYSFNAIRPQEIYIETVDNKITVSYVDKNSQKKFTTMPLEIERGIFVAYKLAYSLHLLKNIEREYLQKNSLQETFSDDDIEFFIK